jgi:transcription elongation factor Elf1
MISALAIVSIWDLNRLKKRRKCPACGECKKIEVEDVKLLNEEFVFYKTNLGDFADIVTDYKIEPKEVEQNYEKYLYCERCGTRWPIYSTTKVNLRK